MLAFTALVPIESSACTQSEEQNDDSNNSNNYYIKDINGETFRVYPDGKYVSERAGTVNLEDFVFDAADIEEGELIDVCVESLDFPQLERNCEIGEDTPANKPETIRVEVPSGIGKNPETRIIETPQIIENDPEPYEIIEEDGTVITVYPDPEEYEDPPVTYDDNLQSSPYDD